MTAEASGRIDVAPELTSDEQRIVDDFARLWWSRKDIFFHQRWMGIGTLQHPFDMWVTQEILYETQPERIVEAGSFFGGSAVMWSMLLEQFGDDGRVIAIDIDDNMDFARNYRLFQERVDFIHGSTVDDDVIGRVRELTAGKRTMVILDSAHDAAHVRAELDLYADLVSPGCYLIVQDGFVNGHPCDPDHGPGPYEALHDFLQTRSDFEIDRSRQRMLFTFNPDGFLRRHDEP